MCIKWIKIDSLEIKAVAYSVKDWGTVFACTVCHFMVHWLYLI